MTTDLRQRRAGILCRISQDRDGESAGPERQEADGRDVAGQRNWDVERLYVERDVSGYKKGVKRPELDRLIADLKHGVIDAVIVWKFDRLSRQGITFVGRFLELLEQTGAVLVSVTEPFIDTTSPMGKGVLGLIASIAEQESKNTSTRVKRAQEDMVHKGRFHGGGYRKFGYTVDGQVVPDEADALREAVKRVLDGETLWSVCKSFNARGIRTTAAGVRRKVKGEDKYQVNDGLWSSRTLSMALRSPRIAGIVQHNGERYAAAWEPIVTVEEHERVVQALTATPLAERTGRRHLLTGLIRCGFVTDGDVCGGRLKYMKWRQPRTGTDFPRYQCVREPGNGHCGRLAVTMRSVDLHVAMVALDFLARARLRPIAVEVDESTLEEQLGAAQEAMTDALRDRFTRRTLTAGDYELVRAELTEEIDDLERRLDGLRSAQDERSMALPLGDREALGKWWDRATDVERRDVMRRVFRRIWIDPAKRRGGNKFDRDRVRFEFNWNLFVESETLVDWDADPEAPRNAAVVAAYRGQDVENLTVSQDAVAAPS